MNFLKRSMMTALALSGESVTNMTDAILGENMDNDKPNSPIDDSGVVKAVEDISSAVSGASFEALEKEAKLTADDKIVQGLMEAEGDADAYLLQKINNLAEGSAQLFRATTRASLSALQIARSAFAKATASHAVLSREGMISTGEWAKDFGHGSVFVNGLRFDVGGVIDDVVRTRAQKFYVTSALDALEDRSLLDLFTGEAAAEANVETLYYNGVGRPKAPAGSRVLVSKTATHGVTNGYIYEFSSDAYFEYSISFRDDSTYATSINVDEIIYRIEPQISALLTPALSNRHDIDGIAVYDEKPLFISKETLSKIHIHSQGIITPVINQQSKTIVLVRTNAATDTQETALSCLSADEWNEFLATDGPTGEPGTVNYKVTIIEAGPIMAAYDSVGMIKIGGSLAAKAYGHWAGRLAELGFETVGNFLVNRQSITSGYAATKLPDDV